MKYATLIAAMCAIAFTGCATLSGPAPPDSAPPTDPGKVWIDSSANTGDILCTLLAEELKPGDLEKAQLSAAAARTVLADPAPSYFALQAALSQGVPPKYAKATALFLRTLKRQLGNAEVLPQGTVAWGMAAGFVDSCDAALRFTVGTYFDPLGWPS